MELKDLPAYRLSLGLSQRQVAEMMGTHQPALVRLERKMLGGIMPSYRYLERYLDALGLQAIIRFEKKKSDRSF